MSVEAPKLSPISKESKEADRLYAERFLKSLPLSGGIFDMISIFLETALGTSKDEGEKKRDRTPRTSEHDYNNG
jgi:hypothetical protein